MECDRYKELEQQLNNAQSRYAQFTYKENRHLRGVSDTRAKQIARDEKDKMAKLSREMWLHRENCPKCNASDAVNSKVPNP